MIIYDDITLDEMTPVQALELLSHPGYFLDWDEIYDVGLKKIDGSDEELRLHLREVLLTASAADKYEEEDANVKAFCCEGLAAYGDYDLTWKMLNDRNDFTVWIAVGCLLQLKSYEDDAFYMDIDINVVGKIKDDSTRGAVASLCWRILSLQGDEWKGSDRSRKLFEILKVIILHFDFGPISSLYGLFVYIWMIRQK